MTATKGGLVPVLSPLGHLTLVPDADAPSIPPEVSRRLHEAFTRGAGPGLWALGAGEVGTELAAVLGYRLCVSPRKPRSRCKRSLNARRPTDASAHRTTRRTGS
jgi:hypothetical protein